MLKKFARLTDPEFRSVGSVTLSIRIWTVSASTGSSLIESNTRSWPPTATSDPRRWYCAEAWLS